MCSNNKGPLVSIIIPIFNVEKYIYQCLDSVISQTYKNLEIILVDDGSPDRCPEICDEYALKDSRVRVIHQKQSGVSVARNTALEVSNGTYIAFVDGDDSVNPRLIERSVDILEQKHLSAVIFEAKLLDEYGRFIGERFKVYDEYTEISAQEALDRIITDELGSQIWKAVYRRRYWENVRFPEGMLYEDMFALHQVYANMTDNVAFLPEQLYHYRLNPNGISLSVDRLGKKAYHIFLGFLSMYNSSQKNCSNEIVDACLANVTRAARIALGYLNLAQEHRNDCKQFLEKEKNQIFSCKKLSWKEKAKVHLEISAPIITHMIRKIKGMRRK